MNRREWCEQSRIHFSRLKDGMQPLERTAVNDFITNICRVEKITHIFSKPRPKGP